MSLSNLGSSNSTQIEALKADARAQFAAAVNSDAQSIGAGLKPRSTKTCIRRQYDANNFNHRQRRCIPFRTATLVNAARREGSTCNSVSQPCDYIGGLTCTARVTTYFVTPKLPLSHEYKCGVSKARD